MRKVGPMRNKLRITLFGVLLMSTLLFTWGAAPIASAATLAGKASSANNASIAKSSTIHTGIQSFMNPYARGFRDGYRLGTTDGRRDCFMRHRGRGRSFRSVQNDYNRGFADGYSRGYNNGFVACRGR